MVVVGVSGLPRAVAADGQVPGIEHVAPFADAWLPEPIGDDWRPSLYGCGFLADHPATAVCSFDVGSGWDERAWTDLRAEVWSATVDGTRASGVDARAQAPILTVPITTDADDDWIRLDIGMRRDGPAWWVVPTAVAPDGQRYRLSDGDGVEIPFNGTVWEWLTAPA
jgi:hypothetical protein